MVIHPDSPERFLRDIPIGKPDLYSLFAHIFTHRFIHRLWTQSSGTTGVNRTGSACPDHPHLSLESDKADSTLGVCELRSAAGAPPPRRASNWASQNDGGHRG